MFLPVPLGGLEGQVAKKSFTRALVVACAGSATVDATSKKQVEGVGRTCLSLFQTRMQQA